jgi:hypothetical protein
VGLGVRSLAAGFRALSHGKLILLLAVTTLLLGLGAAAPLSPALWKDVGTTLAGDHFVRNHPTFAPTDFADFLREDAGAVRGAWGAARNLAIFGVVLQMFFAGGIVVVLGRGPFSFGQFFEPARRNFWHNVKCFFLFAALLAVFYGIVLGGGQAAAKELFENVPPDAASRTSWSWGLLSLAVLLWGVLSLLYDFARAARRYAPTIGAWRAYGFARRALRGSWARALVLFVFWLLLGATAWLGFFAVTWAMPAVSVPAIAGLFLLQFLVIWSRSAIRVAAWGSYLEFLDHRATAALAATARAPLTAAVAPAPGF